MILVDTSVWIDFFRGRGTPADRWLQDALAHDEDLCLCGEVLTEILQGLSTPRQIATVERALQPLVYLPLDREGYVEAAAIYRAARAKGKTIRNTVDCIIAACAIAHNIPLAQNDRDYHTIADVSNLKLVSLG
ncbi:MAG: PIN domain nuclease [Planctomycetota bacterium]|nr:PIN domain nuclease [Planctomycetota bacterium]